MTRSDRWGHAESTSPEARTFEFRRRPTTVDMRTLFTVSLKMCSTLLLVVQPSLGLSDRARRVLSDLQPHLRTREHSRAWPGTELLDDVADVRRYNWNVTTMKIVSDVSEGLERWQQPELPEDPCLLREDDTPVLVTIAHEGDAYVSLTCDEVRIIEREAPRTMTLLRVADHEE